jgi:UDP-N-acetylglucosamine--N-acetylmuramyl-(pentapeptide) pyrophosphoryl-undecaprenol N-acetylglucosamine transferase
MRGPRVRPIVIAAGGTGGHVYPAEALAATLRRRGHWVVLMTDARSGALNSEVFEARDRYILPGAGIAGRGPVRAARALFSLAAGVVKARRILADIRPAAVVAFGGYPAIPPVLAARLLRGGPPVILHEQNAVLGRANRFLARHARRLALNFAATRLVPAGVATAVTGNPVRPAVAALIDADYVPPGAAPAEDRTAPAGTHFGLGGGSAASSRDPGWPEADQAVSGGVRAGDDRDPSAPAARADESVAARPDDESDAADAAIRLLVLGGSLGARVFSDVVPSALIALPAALRARLRVTQQCRAEDMARVRAAYAAAAISAELAPFFTDVAGLLRAAHLVIARAGASTVAELAIAGRPAVLVPLPGAIDDHQTENARALAEAGGAWVVPQAAFTPDALAGRLSGLLADPAALARAAAGARTVARADAAAALADLVEHLVGQNTDVGLESA